MNNLFVHINQRVFLTFTSNSHSVPIPLQSNTYTDIHSHYIHKHIYIATESIIHQFRMNKLCYCQRELTAYDDIDDGRWTCNHCCEPIKKSDQFMYICFNQQCFYKETSATNYCVCSQCFNSNDNDDDKHDDLERNAFILQKFTSSLNTIS